MPEKVKFDSVKAHQRYKLSDGTPVPGVTTVLGVIAKPQLINWAWECGMRGEDYKKVKSKAADIGTLAHWLVECYLKKLDADTSEFSKADLDRAENAVIKFISWWDDQSLKIVSSEIGLVSEAHGYGGTIDILAQNEAGEMVLIDLKSSKAIYKDMWYQLAAYRQLLLETPERRPVNKVFIVRIGKECNTDDFEVQERADLSGEWQIFAAALKLFKLLEGSKVSKPAEKIEF